MFFGEIDVISGSRELVNALGTQVPEPIMPQKPITADRVRLGLGEGLGAFSRMID